MSPDPSSSRVVPVDRVACTPADLERASTWLAGGGIVAYPTDTFYGLAVDPRQAGAVADLFDLKGRDLAMAMPLVAGSRDQVERALGALDPESARLADAFWPGPLSLILQAPSSIAEAVHGGRGSVAVRVPDHVVARALAEAAGWPITATSANRSGEPPASTAGGLADVASDPRVLIIDAGATPGGAPSTIVDARDGQMRCVRAGAIAWDRVLTSR